MAVDRQVHDGAGSSSRINATGQAVTLGGTLNVVLLNGYVPGTCESFTTIDWLSGSGAFATENYPDLGGGSTFNALVAAEDPLRAAVRRDYCHATTLGPVRHEAQS